VPGLVDAGVAVFAQFSGGPGRDPTDLVAEAARLEAAGAGLLDFRHSGPVAGPKVVAAVSVPVIGGLGGGPWLDGRMRMIHRVIGYGSATGEAYANVAGVVGAAVRAYAEDVRAGAGVRGG
jgi:3-methyl-2-oxobutanoate hydroxymethyltransferase